MTARLPLASAPQNRVPIVSVIGAAALRPLFGLHGLAGANPRVVELGILYFCLPVRGRFPPMLALSLTTLGIFAAA